MSSDDRATWWIPRVELARVGVAYLNAADRIVETPDWGGALRYWQPESTTNIDVALFENFVIMNTLRVDPPNAATLAGAGGGA